jgi:hypothetical protein
MPMALAGPLRRSFTRTEALRTYVEVIEAVQRDALWAPAVKRSSSCLVRPDANRDTGSLLSVAGVVMAGAGRFVVGVRRGVRVGAAVDDLVSGGLQDAA